MVDLSELNCGLFSPGAQPSSTCFPGTDGFDPYRCNVRATCSTVADAPVAGAARPEGFWSQLWTDVFGGGHA